MQPFFYDLHMHSCLSPCGDLDMTPNNIVNMAVLKGLDVIAVTDHNTCRNCPPVLHLAQQAGLWAIPGMELNTQEEVHVVCLFPTLEQALRFDAYVYERLQQVPNQPEIFGEQLVLNEQDEIVAREPLLLVSATDISVDAVPRLMNEFGGLAFPSHINRSSNSLIAAFGCLPAREMGFPTVELYRPDLFYSLEINRGMLEGYEVLTNSDAHYLVDIAEPVHRLHLEAANFESLRQRLWLSPACGKAT